MRITISLWMLPTMSMAEPGMKIIGGLQGSIENFAFVASVQSCVSATDLASCSHTCTGSLIAPNVVLTAAHCFRDKITRFDAPIGDTDPSLIKVVLGTSNANIFDSGARLIDVTKIISNRYKTNIRFPWDGDIAILELAECVDESPDLIEYAKVATWETEPARTGCADIIVAGFGTASNVPPPLGEQDGKLRYFEDNLNSPSVCRAAHAAILMGHKVPTILNLDTLDTKITDSVLGDNYICTGGSSIHSICPGDSGGPTFTRLESGKAQVIGVTSFYLRAGTGSVCALGPDFSTRTAFYADWIRDQMTNTINACPDWSVDDSFTSSSTYPEEDLSVEWTRSRCSDNEWQCRSGQCISVSLLCDTTPDCSDESDETYSVDGTSLCPSSRRLSSEPNEQSNYKVGESVPVKDARNSYAVVPCSTAISQVTNAVNQVTNEQSTIGDIFWDPTSLMAACDLLLNCDLETGSVNVDTYTANLDTCYAIKSWYEATLQKNQYAKTFGQVYGASCPDDEYINRMTEDPILFPLDSSTTSSSSSTTSSSSSTTSSSSSTTSSSSSTTSLSSSLSFHAVFALAALTALLN